MLTNFQKSFTDRFISKFATKSSLTIPPHRNCVTTLLCEISVFKNCHAQDLSLKSKVSCKTQPLKTVVKKFITIIVALFSSLAKRYKSVRTKFPQYDSIRICCDAEEKISQQNAFAYDKWSVSYLLPVTLPNVNRFLKKLFDQKTQQ